MGTAPTPPVVSFASKDLIFGTTENKESKSSANTWEARYRKKTVPGWMCLVEKQIKCVDSAFVLQSTFSSLSNKQDKPHGSEQTRVYHHEGLDAYDSSCKHPRRGAHSRHWHVVYVRVAQF